MIQIELLDSALRECNILLILLQRDEEMCIKSKNNHLLLIQCDAIVSNNTKETNLFYTLTFCFLAVDIVHCSIKRIYEKF